VSYKQILIEKPGFCKKRSCTG